MYQIYLSMNKKLQYDKILKYFLFQKKFTNKMITDANQIRLSDDRKN